MGDSSRNGEATSPVRSDAFLRTVIDSTSEAIAVIDADGVIVLVNDAWRKSFAPIGPQTDAPAPPTDVGANYLGAWEDAIRRDSSGGSTRTALGGIKAVSGGSASRFDLAYPCHASGQQRWFSMRVTPLNLGGRPGATITQVDITESKKIEQALVESEERFSRFMDALPAAAFIKDEDGAIVYVNRVMAGILGPKAWLAQSSRDLFPSELAEKMIADDRRALELGDVVTEEQIPASDGRQRHYRTHKFRIPRQGRRSLIGAIALDITERKRMEDQVRHLASFDQLTDPPNRRLLSERLSHAIAANQRLGCHGAVMFVDLDDFKSINDALGHQVGDLLLVEAAARLKSCVRKMDTVARFGGDEFVVLIGELDADRSESVNEVRIIAEKLRVAMARPYSLRIRRAGSAEATVERECTASIGVALFDRDEDNQDSILGRADSAMYEAKLAGCNLIRFHDPAT